MKKEGNNYKKFRYRIIADDWVRKISKNFQQPFKRFLLVICMDRHNGQHNVQNGPQQNRSPIFCELKLKCPH